MLNVQSYFDLCINEQCVKGGENYEKTISTLYEYGYRTVAINQVLSENNIPQSSKKKKSKKDSSSSKEVDIVPAPFEIKPVKGCENMSILNRLTIEFSNQDCIHKIIRSPNYKKYHLVASQPTTLAALTFTCNNFEADLFTYTGESRFPFKFNRKTYKQLIERGYHLELLYTPMIEDSSKRKNIIQLSHLYYSYGKLKNIVVSSGARNRFHLRGPYDIMNLGLILAFNEKNIRYAIGVCGRNTYLHAVSRVNSKAVVFVGTDKPKSSKSPELSRGPTRASTPVQATEDDSEEEIEEPENEEEAGPSRKRPRQ